MNFIPLKSGTSVGGDEITAFKSDTKGAKYTYLIGGVHGDEVEGVYVLEQLFTWLKDSDELSLPMIVVPILNVDGYRNNTRVNSHGVDLNRNLPTTTWSADFEEDKNNPGPNALSEPENEYLDKLFKKFPPKFILTFHSWKPILNYNGDCEEIAKFLSTHNEYPVADDIGYPTPGSLGTYAPEKYNSPVLTFECPLLSTGKSLKEIWKENEKGLKELFEKELL